jgi:alkylation response protein AidB-like acyl-CoA dehydrogenase
MDGNAHLPSDEERTMLRDAVRGLLGQHWPTDKALDFAADTARLKGIWRLLGEQGYAALGVDAASGGLREILVVLSELGRAACPAPMLDAAILNLFLGAEAKGADFLAGLREGQAFACLSFAGADPDSAVGCIAGMNGRFSGTVNFVEAASCATHLAFLAEDASALVVVRLDEHVSVTPARAMGADGQYSVELQDASGLVLPLDKGRLGDMLAVSRLCHAARAWGAANRAFELAVDYAKLRQQFGQPIGRFQAIQHKLANNFIALTGAQAALDNAASHFDRGAAEWRTFAAAAFAYANATLRQVSLETHHAVGAIGYAEDHEAPRHFKRVHLDMLRHGGGRPVREELAARYLGDSLAELPELDLGPRANAFRHEMRAWLAEHWPAGRRLAYEASEKAHREYDAAFARELGSTGWLGLTWPRKFGGLERGPYELLAFLEETMRVDTPRAGAPIQAASWMIYGTPEQQQRYLPEILRGEVIYGMWYSEPNSGSDLASLRTRAERDGEGWVINGEKIWTTTYWGDYMWLAARTDPAAKPKHAGISVFLVRTDTPGITRKPIRAMYDGEFCNTFFDNVRVGKDALVGEVNKGWEVLTGALGTERAFVGASILAKLCRHFEEVCEHIREVEVGGRPLRLDPVVRNAIGLFAAELEVGRQLSIRPISILASGVEPTWEAAIPKVFGGELMERFSEAVLDMLGLSATLSAKAPGAPMRGRIEQKLRHSLMWVISLGTNEIQRSMIAQRGLGLPR